MRKLINHDEMRKEWVIEHWYEKVIYVLGYVLLVIYALAFTFGFLAAFFAEINK